MTKEQRNKLKKKLYRHLVTNMYSLKVISSPTYPTLMKWAKEDKILENIIYRYEAKQAQAIEKMMLKSLIDPDTHGKMDTKLLSVYIKNKRMFKEEVIEVEGSTASNLVISVIKG